MSQLDSNSLIEFTRKLDRIYAKRREIILISHEFHQNTHEL